MANEALHTIRFKRGEDEFELTSTAEEVAKVRAMLEPYVETTFAEAGGPVEEEGEEKPAAADKARAARGGRRGRRRGGRRQQAESGSGDERAAVRERLLNTPLEGFPKMGSKPTARLAGYATLAWAREKLGIDGLTAPEIQAFIESKWRLKRSQQAFGQALSEHVRSGEIDVQGSPKVYRLMAPGDEALAQMLAELPDKKS
jgi:hypothetical protein